MTIRLSRRAQRLRNRVLCSPRDQVFPVPAGRLLPPDTEDKHVVRSLHTDAVKHRVARSRPSLERHENRLLSLIASGDELRPERIRSRLVMVLPGSEDELLFRYARLHWSIPVSAGYGRRLRFIVYDESNSKLIGIGSPGIVAGKRKADDIGFLHEALLGASSRIAALVGSTCNLLEIRTFR